MPFSGSAPDVECNESSPTEVGLLVVVDCEGRGRGKLSGIPAGCGAEERYELSAMLPGKGWSRK